MKSAHFYNCKLSYGRVYVKRYLLLYISIFKLNWLKLQYSIFIFMFEYFYFLFTPRKAGVVSNRISLR